MKNLVFLLSIVFMVSVLWAEEEQSGTLEGLVIEKGDKHILFIADGETEAKKYIPHWRGGAPKDGGGLDKETLEKIKKLITPNRVKLKWKFEEHLRIESIEVLEPEKKEGRIEGTVHQKGEKWIDIVSEENGVKRVERLFPKWIGGMPKQGGGLDKKALGWIKELQVNDKVVVEWEYDERKRLVGVKKVK